MTLSAGCSSILAPDATQSINDDFIGTVPDLHAAIAISANEGHVLAFLCDGGPDHITLAQWFTGSVTTNPTILTNSAGYRLTLYVMDGGVSGDVTIPTGHVYSYQVSEVERGYGTYAGNWSNQPGLYRLDTTVRGVPYRWGWLRLDTGAFILATASGTPYAPLYLTEAGGLINEQTHALFTTPPPDFVHKRVTIPGLGVYPLQLCLLDKCSTTAQ